MLISLVAWALIRTSLQRKITIQTMRIMPILHDNQYVLVLIPDAEEGINESRIKIGAFVKMRKWKDNCSMITSSTRLKPREGHHQPWKR